MKRLAWIRKKSWNDKTEVDLTRKETEFLQALSLFLKNTLTNIYVYLTINT
ncbi:hypothetical protein [Butyrivibrio sp.]|uniref:hypothetical protein n=1 Tax=Butyrivibrio sp. TaxID=28121 RepID=UPI0025B83372|nr:hypothetical protein [Butyrivibrio sp.]MBQ9302749.1 hypothetical protein [Butyrivibrio sp.]